LREELQRLLDRIRVDGKRQWKTLPAFDGKTLHDHPDDFRAAII
jgi:hypothetical protein